MQGTWYPTFKWVVGFCDTVLSEGLEGAAQLFFNEVSVEMFQSKSYHANMCIYFSRQAPVAAFGRFRLLPVLRGIKGQGNQLRAVTFNSEFLSVRLMHGTGKKKVGMVVVIMQGSVLKYLVKEVFGNNEPGCFDRSQG